jgi:hypothetical protein
VYRSACVWGCLTILISAAAWAQDSPAFKFGGDLRLRYENTSDGNGALSTSKGVVRMRAGVSYPLREDLTIRARLATGSANDPNSTDITLSQFVNDLEVSLDLALIELSHPHWGAVGGKFINPFFTATELVWDGDVDPQGVSGRVVLGNPTGVSATLTGLYFIVDQQSGGTGSDMAGGQITLRAVPDSSWRLAVGAAYWDYRLGILTNADAGDIRTNRLIPGGERYLSDFNLVDAVISAEYTGLGEHLPLRVVGEYVKNTGADDLNTGWEADLYLGRSQRPGDLRGRYGFALVETDAVLAAFSHDNTTLGTNTETHTLAVEAIPVSGLLLNATWYLYRPHEVAVGAPREFQSRLRLNAMVSF